MAAKTKADSKMTAYEVMLYSDGMHDNGSTAAIDAELARRDRTDRPDDPDAFGASHSVQSIHSSGSITRPPKTTTATQKPVVDLDAPLRISEGKQEICDDDADTPSSSGTKRDAPEPTKTKQPSTKKARTAGADYTKTKTKKKKKKKTKTGRSRFEDLKAEESECEDADLEKEARIAAAEARRLDAKLALGLHKNSEWRNRVGGRGDSDDDDDSIVCDDEEEIEFMSKTEQILLQESIEPPRKVTEKDKAADEELDAILSDVDMTGAKSAAVGIDRQPASRRSNGNTGPKRIPKARAATASTIAAWGAPRIANVITDPSAWGTGSAKLVMSSMCDKLRMLANCKPGHIGSIPGSGDAQVKSMLSLLLRLARHCLTPDVAKATDTQMLGFIHNIPDEIQKASEETFTTTLPLLKKIFESRGGKTKTQFLRVVSAGMATTFSTHQVTIPEDCEQTFVCAWSDKEIKAGDNVWLCAAYSANDNEVRLFYVSRSALLPNFYVQNIAAIRTYLRWAVMFMRYILQWQISEMLPESCSADMRMTRFLTSQSATDCCASALATFFSARHIVKSHIS